MNQALALLSSALKQQIENIPAAFAQEEVIRRSIICLLWNALQQMDLLPLPGWKPPRSTRESLDLVGIRLGGEVPIIEMAFVVDPVVELPRVRSLEWVDCPHKIYVAFSQKQEKVNQTSFFLPNEVNLLNLYS